MTKQETRLNRDSGIELLRIFLMILITLHHFSLYSGIKDISKTTYYLCEWGGKIGVEIFLIISGYFMVKSEFKIRKIIILWFQIFFYSIGLLLIDFCINKPNNISKLDIIGYFIPINSLKYGFITNYMHIYILSPFIIRLIKTLKDKELKKFIIVCCIMYILSNNLLIGAKIEYFENTFGFIFFFIVGCYFRMYGSRYFEKNIIKNISISVLIVIIYTGFKLLIEKINIQSNGIIDFINRFINLGVNSIFTLYISVSLFYCFLSIKVKNSFINYIASCSLSVYLIQEHPKSRNIIWKTIFNIYSANRNNFFELMQSNTNIVNKISASMCSIISMYMHINASKLFIIYALVCTIFIFIFAILVDSIRKITIEIILKKTIKIKKIEKILNFIDDWMNGINVEQNEKANEHSKI